MIFGSVLLYLGLLNYKQEDNFEEFSENGTEPEPFGMTIEFIYPNESTGIKDYDQDINLQQ